MHSWGVCNKFYYFISDTYNVSILNKNARDAFNFVSKTRDVECAIIYIISD